MKNLLKLLAMATALVSFSHGASAADPGMPPSWNGFYLGGNVGMGGENWTFSFYDSQIPAGGTKTVSNSAFVGGMQAGYNWQMNQVVLGIEADLQASGLKSDQQGGFSFDSCGCFNVSMDSFGTLRGRAGFEVSPTLLVYGTGGAILGHLNYSAADSNPVGSASQWNVGWTVGAGAEFMIDPKLSLKAEALYYDFGSPFFDLGDTGFNTNLGINGYLARIGANYHF